MRKKRKTRDGKLRGDAARAARMTAVAKQAAASALDGEARRRTLLRVIATLVERLGGDARLTFREVAGAPELGMSIEGAGTADAVMLLAVADRDPEGGIIVGDRVLVHSWSPSLDLEADPERTGLELPGEVTQIDGGELFVVRLDAQNPLELELVVVRRGWLRPLSAGSVVNERALQQVGEAARDLSADVAELLEQSTQVDAESAPVPDGLEGAPREELLRQLRHLRLAHLKLAGENRSLKERLELHSDLEPAEQS